LNAELRLQVPVSAAGKTAFLNSTIQGPGSLTIPEGVTVELAATTVVAVPLHVSGVLEGTGRIISDLTNAGLVRPGTSPGRLQIEGDFTQTATGTLEIDIAGLIPATQFDRIEIAGRANLSGKLKVVIDPAFFPGPTASFEFLTYLIRSGDFLLFEGLTFAGGRLAARPGLFVYPLVSDRDPVAVDDVVTTLQDTSSPLFDVLANDVDPGDELSLLAFSQPSQGTLAHDGFGKFIYTPLPNYVGPDTFTYVIRDLGGATDTGLVLINVVSTQEAAAAEQVSQRLSAGVLAVNSSLGSWGEAFNLGPGAPMPALPSQLGDLFGLSSALTGLSLPTVGLAGSFADLAGALQGQGFTVTNIAGAVPGIPAPASGESLRLRFPISFGDLAQAASFTPPAFNFDSPQLFSGLASSSAPTVTPDWLGNLALDLSFGVDDEGFFLAVDSAFELRIAGSAALGGSAAIGGSLDTALSGNAAADVVVALLLQAPGGKLRPSEFGAAVNTLFRATAGGTAAINFGFSLPVGSFDYRSAYILTPSSTEIATLEIDQTLTGGLRLPGLEEVLPGGHGPAQIGLIGSFDGTTWTLSGGAAPGAVFKIGGFSLDSPAFTLVLSPATISGSGIARLTAEFGGAGQFTFDLSFAFSRDSFSISGSTTLPAQTFGVVSFLWLDSPSVGLSVTSDYASLPVVTLQVTAAAAVLFPELPSASLPPPGFATVTGFSGTLSSTGLIELTAATLAVDPSPGLRLEAKGAPGTPGVRLVLDPTVTAPDAPFATLVNVVVNAPTLAFLSALTVGALTLRRSGFDLTGFVLGPQPLDFEGLLRFEQFTVTSDAIRFRIDTGFSAAVTISASRAVFLPASSVFTAEFTDLAGTIDLGAGPAEFELSAAQLNARIADVASMTLQNVELYLGNAPNRPLFVTGSAIATAPLLGDLALTLTDLQIARDGDVSLASAAVTSANVLASFGLAEIIPLQITAVRFEFPTLLSNGRRSLDTVDISVDARFIPEALAGLPFAPILTVAGVSIVAGEFFTLTLSVESLAAGRIAPRDIGPITVGFSGWDVGGVQLDGLLELGVYDANGVLQPLPGITAQARGTFTVTTSSNPDLAVGASVTALGTFSSAANGAHLLDLAGAFNVDAEGNTLAGQVKLDFTARFTATPPIGTAGWALAVSGEISRVTVSDLVIRLGDVLEVTVTEAVFGDDPLTPAVEVFVATNSTVRLLAYPNATSFTLSIAGLSVTTTQVVIDDLLMAFSAGAGMVPSAFSVVNLGLSIDASFDYTQSGNSYTVANLSGNIQLSADSVAVFPGSAGGALFSAGNIAGFFESNGEILLTAATASANVGDTFALSFTSLQFYLGADPLRDRVSIGSVSATFAGLSDVSITLAGFRVSNAGFFAIESASAMAPGGVFQTIGLGGLLPFDITQVTFVFTDASTPKNLAHFRLEVAGTFNTSLMARLPFTPILSIGGVTNGFAFSVTYNGGVFAPFDVADITLGFADLPAGDLTLGATVTLGGYAGGVFQNRYGGSISVSGLDGAALSLTLEGSLSGNRLVMGATLAASFTFGHGLVEVTNAGLVFNLEVIADGTFALRTENFAFTAANLERLRVHFGDLFAVETTNVALDFAPATGAPLATFGSVSLVFGAGTPAAGWGGTVGQFAIGSDFEVYLLDGFFISIDIGDTAFGLPEFLPVLVNEVGFRFLDGAVSGGPGGAVAGGSRLENLSDLVLILSGGIATSPTWPIGASFDGLELSLADFLAGRFAIKNLDGLQFEVPRFQLGEAEIGGTFAIGSVTVNEGTPQQRTAYYVQLGGSFAFGGLDLGITIAFSQYGPLAAIVGVPLAVPLGPTGLLLQSVTGGLNFGGDPWPSVATPLELLTNPVFDLPTTLTLGEIKSRLTAVLNLPNENARFTWTRGFTVSLTATVTTVATPGILTGDLTLAANLGFGAGGGLRWLASGNVRLFGIELGAAGLLIDLSNLLNPKLDFAFAAPTPGNPLAFLFPAQGQFTVSLRTDGLLEAPILGLGVFFDQLARGALPTGQGYFRAMLDVLAERIDADRGSRLAVLLLAGTSAPASVTSDFLLERLAGSSGLLPRSAGGIGANTIAQAGELTYLLTGAFLDVLGDHPQAGVDALSEFSRVLQNAVGAAIDAGWDAFNPGFGLRGFLQPTIFGFPFGQPTDAVELILDKRGVSFALTTSLIASLKRSLDLISGNLVGTLATLVTLGFEDRVEMGFTLRFPDVGRLAKLLQGGSIVEPSGAIQLLDFLVDTINPFANWEVLFRGELLMLGFRVGELSGIFFGPQLDGSGAFAPSGLFASRVVNLDPDGDGRPNADLAASVDNAVGLIPVSTKAHYEDAMRWGGALLTAQLFLPKVLKDPVEVFTQDINWTLPDANLDDPLQALAAAAAYGDWLNALVADLTADQAFARIQFFFPSPAVLFDPSSYLEGGGGGSLPGDDGSAGGYRTSFRVKPIDQALTNLLIDALDSAYVEGFVEVELLSITFGRMEFSVTAEGLRVTGQVPWLSGLSGSFTLRRSTLNLNQLARDLVQSPLVARIAGPLVGVPDGSSAAVAAKFRFLTDARVNQISLPFPVAGLEIAVSSAPLAQWLSSSFGLPGSIFNAPNGDASAISFGAFTPGYGATGVQRFGGFSLTGNLNIAGLVQNASFLFEVELFNFTGGLPLPNFVARASVDRFAISGLDTQGLPATVATLTNAFTEIRRTPAGLSAGLGGTLTLLGSNTFFFGGSLTILAADPSPGLFGEITMSSSGGGLSGNLFSLNGNFALQINTTAVARTVDRPGVPVAQDPVIAARSAAIRVDGTLSAGSLVLDGFFRLGLNPGGLQMEVFAVASMAPLGSFAAQGVLDLNANGLLGRLEFESGAALQRAGIGWVFNARFAAELNTRSTAATVTRVSVDAATGAVNAGTTAEVTIAAQTVRLFAAGSLLLRQGEGRDQTDAFLLRGGFEIGLSASALTLNALAFVEVLGLGTFAVGGAFQINSAGAAGILNLGAAPGSSATVTRAGSGYSFDGRFRLEFNTTGIAVTNVAGSGQNLVAGRYVRVLITGNNLGDPAVLALGAFQMSARFSLEAGTATVGGRATAVLAVTATDATLRVISGATNLFSMSADGALLLTPSGIAAKIALGANTATGPGYGLSGQFIFELNTTTLAIPTISGKTVDLAAGPYTRIAITGVGGTGNATLTVGGVNLVGQFTFTAGNQIINGTSQLALTLTAKAVLQLRAAGVRVFDLNLDGALAVFSGGTAAQLAVSQSAGPEAVLGFTVSGGMAFTFEVFTAASGSVTLPKASSPINAGLRIIANGSMTLGGFTLTGAFGFQVGQITTGGASQTGLLVTVGTAAVPVTTALRVGETTLFTFTASGALQVSSFGIAARLTLTSGAGVSNVTFGQNATANGFSVTGSFFFEVNTTNRTTAIAGIEAGVFVRFGGTATMGFRLAGVDAFTATGTLQFAVSGSNLSLRIAGSVNAGFLGSFSVDRTLTISAGGVVGVLDIGTGANASLTGARFSFNARLQLQINTTSTAVTLAVARVDINSTAATPEVTVQSVTVAAGTVSVLVAGRLQLQQGSGASATDAFLADGNFTVTKSGANFAMAGDARVDLRFLGRMTGAFNVTVTSGGVAGVVRLANHANTTLNGAGFRLNGFFSLEFNTTSASVTVTAGRVAFIENTVLVSNGAVQYQDVTIPAFTVRLFVGGEIQLLQGAGQTNSFRLFGGMGLEVSASGLRVRGDLVLDLLRLANLSGSVDFQMSSAGIAATITVGTSGQTTVDRTGFVLNARFRLEVNTTASSATVQRIRVDATTGAVVFSGGVPVVDNITLPARTVRLFAAGAMVFREGTGTSATDSFRMNGGITLSVSGSDLSVSATGFVDLSRMASGLTLAFNSSFTITSAGIAASFALESGSRVTRSGAGFDLNARFYLEVNTTSALQTFTRSGVVASTGAFSGTVSVTLAARSIRLGVAGSLNLGASSLWSLHGQVGLTFAATGFDVAFDMGFNFLGHVASVSGAGILRTGGVAYNLLIQLGGSSSPTFTAVPGFNLGGTFRLQINTFASEMLSLAANTFRVRVTNAKLAISSFELTGSMNFGISSGRFRADVSLSCNMWGFKVFTFSGWIRSDGFFDLTASGSVNLTSSGNGFSGTLSFRLKRDSGGYSFFGDADGQLVVFGVTLASVDGWVTETGKVKFTISILGFSGTVGFDLANSGRFFDGPIAGGTVFFDANFNLRLDPGEPSTVSDGEGSYRLEVPLEVFDRNGNGRFDADEGQIVGVGGVDSFTGVALTVPMRAPASALGTGVPVMLSPISSLVMALLDQGLSAQEANAVIWRAASATATPGLPVYHRDLAEELGDGRADSFALFRLGAQLQTAAEQVSAFLDGVGGVPASGLATAFYGGVAQLLVTQPAANGVTILGNSAGVTQLLDDMAAAVGLVLPEGLVSGAAQVIAAGVKRLGEVESSTAALGEVARVQAVGLDQVAEALREVGAGSTPMSSVIGQYTGLGLEAAIAAAPVPATPLPPTEPRPPEISPPASVAFEVLSDGTQQVTVIGEITEPIRGEFELRIVDPHRFQVTLPVLPQTKVQAQSLTLEVATASGTGGFLEVRSSLDGYDRLLARLPLKQGSASYEVRVDLPASPDSVGFQVQALTFSNGDLAFEFERITVRGLLRPLDGSEPGLAPLEEQVLADGAYLQVPIDLSDTDTALAKLAVSAWSSDRSLLPTSALTLTGTGARRILTIAPARGWLGEATVTVGVTDGVTLTTQSFRVEVYGQNAAPRLSRIADLNLRVGEIPAPIHFQVADLDSAEDVLQVTVSSTNPSLVKASGLVLAGAGQDRILQIVPEPGRVGTSVITVSVADGEKTSTRQFTLRIEPLQLVIMDWASAADHGLHLGEVALSIPDDGSFSEPRFSGIQRLLVTFNTAIDPGSFTADRIGLTGLFGPNNASIDLSGVQWTTSLRNDDTVGVIEFSQPLPDQARYRIALSGVVSVRETLLTGDRDRVMTALAGDINGDRVVDAADVGILRGLRSTDWIDLGAGAQVRSDLTADGRITNTDLGGLNHLLGGDVRFLGTPPWPREILPPLPGESTRTVTARADSARLTRPAVQAVVPVPLALLQWSTPQASSAHSTDVKPTADREDVTSWWWALR
jgi:hypothetical protein